MSETASHQPSLARARAQSNAHCLQSSLQWELEIQRLRVIAKQVKPGTRLRLGGLVAPGSIVREDQLDMHFEVTDGNRSIKVAYHGILPDLFREGQGVVAEGTLEPGGSFRADTVLAKHDETYMPREVADALKKQGHWKDDYGKPSAQGRAQ